MGRRRQHLVALGLAAVLAATGLAPSSAAPGADRVPAGPTGGALVLESGRAVHAFDVATDLGGTTYVAWLASNSPDAGRFAYLCVLPAGETACSGGVKSTYASGTNDSGLRILTSSYMPLVLVWFQDTPDSVNGPMNARILQAELVGGVLTDPEVIGPAPSFGSLRNAVRGPDNAVHTVTAEAAGQGDRLYYQQGQSTPVTIDPRFLPGRVALGFHDGRPVLVTNEYGAVAEPLHAAYRGAGGGWSPFAEVPGTWTVGNENGGAFDLGQATSGLRLVASVDDARYLPQVGRWDGAGFTGWRLTGDRNPCAPTSHDLHADPTGRLADVSFECDEIVVANMPKAGKAALTRFPVDGTPVGDPRIATSTRGDGWVAWTVSQPGGGHLLRARPVMLPALRTTKRSVVKGGKALLTGPVSCLPAVDTALALRAKPRRGWKVRSRVLRLDGARHGKLLDGASVAPGSEHTLTGRVVFRKDGRGSTAKVALQFEACPMPSFN